MSVLTTLFQDFAARLCSTEFLQDARHCDHPTAFSRCRKLPLPTLVAIMLTGMRMSIQAELDTFFAHLRQQAQLVHEVSEQAFAQARAKLSLTAIPQLNDWLIARAHAAFPGMPKRMSESARAQVIALKRHPAVRVALVAFVGWKPPPDNDDKLPRSRARLLYLWGDHDRLASIVEASTAVNDTHCMHTV